MSLVEGVPGERFYQVKHLFRQPLVVALIQSPFYEFVSFLLHNSRYLLAHGLANYIRLAQAVSGQGLRNEEHLVLVDNDPVRLLQNVFQPGVRVFSLPLAVFRLDERIYMIHGSRPVERYHGGNIKQGGGFEVFYVAAHTGAFKLEEPRSLTGREESKGLCVVKGYTAQVHMLAGMFLDDADGPVQDGKVGQAKKVHFKEAQFGNGVHGELSHCHIVVGAFDGPLQRHVFSQRLLGYDHPGGVRAGVADHALKPSRVFYQPAQRLIVVVGIL